MAIGKPEDITSQTFQLIDAGQRQIGQVTIESREDHLICGTFTPGADYEAVEDLFQQFEKAVDVQALSIVDELDSKVDALGLHLYSPINAEMVDIHDVQIWSDGNITCKICDRVDYQQFIMEGLKGLPPEALVEINDFVYFVRKRVLQPNLFTAELVELQQRGQAGITPP